jgi:DNA-binding transcriptional LysR family regulator
LTTTDEHDGGSVFTIEPITAAVTNLTVEQVLSYPIVSSPVSADMARHFSALYGRGRVMDATGDLHTDVTIDSIAMALPIVEYSDGIVPVPYATIADAVERGRLCVLDIDLPWLAVEFGAISLASRSLSPAAARLIEILEPIAGASVLDHRRLASHSPAPAMPPDTDVARAC